MTWEVNGAGLAGLWVRGFTTLFCLFFCVFEILHSKKLKFKFKKLKMLHLFLVYNSKIIIILITLTKCRPPKRSNILVEMGFSNNRTHLFWGDGEDSRD